MEWKEYTAKSVSEALTNACIELGTNSENVEYEVVEKESSKLLGLINKPAVIRVRLKEADKDPSEAAGEFLSKVFDAMNMVVEVTSSFDEDDKVLSVELAGDEMGILIGKRGITLDSLQYLISLVVNRNTEDYIKVKLDTENYRKRRKETLENLAKNLAQKVRRTHKSVFLEPMNPYERRVIHSTLQKDRYVETHSEGEEPYRKVVITLKPGVDTGYEGRGRYSKGRSYGRNGYRKPYRNNYRKPYRSENPEESYGEKETSYESSYKSDSSYEGTEGTDYSTSTDFSGNEE